MSVIMITIIIINMSWNSIKCYSTASLLTKQRLDLQRSGVIHLLIGQLQNHRPCLLLPTDFKVLGVTECEHLGNSDGKNFLFIEFFAQTGFIRTTDLSK